MDDPVDDPSSPPDVGRNAAPLDACSTPESSEAGGLDSIDADMGVSCDQIELLR